MKVNNTLAARRQDAKLALATATIAWKKARLTCDSIGAHERATYKAALAALLHAKATLEAAIGPARLRLAETRAAKERARTAFDAVCQEGERARDQWEKDEAEGFARNRAARDAEDKGPGNDVDF